jgi:hypothetical protein
LPTSWYSLGFSKSAQKSPRLERLPLAIQTVLSAIVLVLAMVVIVTVGLWLRAQLPGKPTPSLESDVAQTLKALDENSVVIRSEPTGKSIVSLSYLRNHMRR